MSQEKVNRYKKEKANRKEIVKKEKRLRIVEITAAILISHDLKCPAKSCTAKCQRCLNYLKI